MTEPLQCGLVLLAAGGSSRMGRPKQLLPLNGRPLVRHVAEIVLAAPVSPVVVVLGAHAGEIKPALAGLAVQIAVNPEWSEGLGTSLRTGVESSLKHTPGLQAIIIVLADQPGLPPRHLDQMITRFLAGGCTAVASLTGRDQVPPLLFGKEWFPKLCTIRGDLGARSLLREHEAEVATVPLASNTDLDTLDDYARFTR